MRGALYALRILARKYEFKDEEERGPLAPIVAGFLPPLLLILQVGGAPPRARPGEVYLSTADESSSNSTIFILVSGRSTRQPEGRHCPGSDETRRLQSLLALNASSLEVAELLKLVLKTFWSATFMGVPAVLLRPDQFTGWTTCFLELIRRPVPQARSRLSDCEQSRAVLHPGVQGKLDGDVTDHLWMCDDSKYRVPATGNYHYCKLVPTREDGKLREPTECVASCGRPPHTRSPLHCAGGAAAGLGTAQGVAVVEGEEVDAARGAPPV